MLATVHNDFANLTVSATSDDAKLLYADLATRLVRACGTLPPGMSVDSTIAIDVSLQSTKPVRDFRFAVRIDGLDAPGSRESGEHLEAQAWNRNGSELMLGTEDGESLQYRMGWMSSESATDNPISYLADGLVLDIPYIRPNAHLTFHFVLAYNKISSGDESLWFAVDVPHPVVLSRPSISYPKLTWSTTGG